MAYNTPFIINSSANCEITRFKFFMESLRLAINLLAFLVQIYQNKYSLFFFFHSIPQKPIFSWQYIYIYIFFEA